MARRLLLSLLAALVAALPAAAQADLDSLLEKATQQAVRRVAPSVVQIETSGGADVLARDASGRLFRKAAGPTTGLVVGADGYVLTSAFNFVNKPSAVFVAVPGHKERYVAKAVATDKTRMLTLLKIEAKNLSVPAAAPKKEMRVGQTVLALGRTWTGPEALPSINGGILSAVQRIWGKAIQTDAKVSPVNYGGPLIDLEGRVLGILIPADPTAEGELSGVEWYDSGIGFAIPLEDANAALERLKAGKDLVQGRLGVTMASKDIYSVAPVLQFVTPGSAADKAGLRAGDTVVEVDGKPVARQAHMMHLLGPKYEGDAVTVKVLRGQEAKTFAGIRLDGSVSDYVYPFLGILPLRDDNEPGVAIRYVFPKSPAEAAGLKPGDRLTQLAPQGGAPGRPTPGRPMMLPIQSRDQLLGLLHQASPGTALEFQVKRKEGDKTESVKAVLTTQPDVMPDSLPQPATARKALAARKAPAGPVPPVPAKGLKKGDAKKKDGEKKEEKKEEKAEDKKEEKKVETGILERTSAAANKAYSLFVPDDYDPNVSYALVVWLHPANKGKDKDFEALVEAWEEYCTDHHVILVAPKAENEAGWIAGEAEAVAQVARDVMLEYTVDRQRVVAHGMGVGGQFAYYLGFNMRDVFRGVAATGAALSSSVKDNTSGQRLAFFVVAGGKDPLAPTIAEGKNRLAQHKYPLVYREIAAMGHQYLDLTTLEELVRWIDSLDQL